MSEFDRRQGIGASEAATVLGLSPWQTPTELWLSKTGDEPVYLSTGDDQTPAMEWGHRLEPAILEKYNEEMGWAGAVPPAETRMHPDGLPIFATPDGLPADGCVDAKCTNFDMDWGEEGTDEVPDHYMVQGVIQMAVFDRPWVDFAVLFLSRRRFGIWRVERDRALEDVVLDRLSVWWSDHVVGGEPPDPGATSYLKTLDSDGAMLEAGGAQRVLLRELFAARADKKDAETRYDELTDLVKRAIGPCDGIKADGLGKVSWKTTKKGRQFRPTPSGDKR